MDEPGDATPRGNASTVRGMCLLHFSLERRDKDLQIYQSLPLFNTCPVRARRAFKAGVCTPTAADFSFLQDPLRVITAASRAVTI